MYLLKLYNQIGDDYSIHQKVRSLVPSTYKVLFQTKGGCVTIATCLNIEGSKEIKLDAQEGSQYLFDIRVNPARRDRKTGKVTSLHETNHVAWFKKKAEENGFEIIAIKTEDEGSRSSQKGQSTITIRSLFIIGMLIVKDKEKFNRALQHGIGRGKGLGFGLLNIFN